LSQSSRLFVIGASAGGIEALKVLLRELPQDFPAAVLAVLHLPAQGPNLLASILRKFGSMPVLDATDGAPIRDGHVYLGVPDHHLLVDGNVMRLTRGPKENRSRPAIDALFRSAAYTRGAQAVGVVLTGMLDDGTAGLWSIKNRSGIAVVQSPADAQFPSMPISALKHVSVDHVVELSTMPALLTQIARQPLETSVNQGGAMNIETKIAAGHDPLQVGALELGQPSRFTCPECHGVLGELHEGPITRFRCHTGHAYSMQTLLAEGEESIDDGLWGVLRSMHERSLLLREAAALARGRNDVAKAEILERRAIDCDNKAQAIRVLLQDPVATTREQSAIELDV
jgi:two-component system chemotaxis response regulator CheB